MGLRGEEGLDKGILRFFERGIGRDGDGKVNFFLPLWATPFLK